MNIRFATIAAALLVLLASSANAVTHDVSIVGLSFRPNDLTIAVGDTVRWTNNGGVHDVRSDTGDWASAVSFTTYERTFNSVEEIFYHCGVHSAPGQNINTSMNGRISVVEAEEPTFRINSGLSDAWYFEPTDGQGFFIIVWEESQQIFLSWFTFDTERPSPDSTAILGEPGHRWLVAVGDFSGDTATLTVYQRSGGVFDSPEPPVGPSVAVGTMTIVWASCTEGLVSYELPALGLMGDIPIKRIVLDNVPACEAAQQPAQ